MQLTTDTYTHLCWPRGWQPTCPPQQRHPSGSGKYPWRKRNQLHSRLEWLRVCECMCVYTVPYSIITHTPDLLLGHTLKSWSTILLSRVGVSTTSWQFKTLPTHTEQTTKPGFYVRPPQLDFSVPHTCINYIINYFAVHTWLKSPWSGFCPGCFEWWSTSDLFEHF